MTKEDLIRLKEKLNELTEEENKLRNIYLRKISTGEFLGPPVGYASIDKPWLKYYEEKDVLSDIPKKTIYRYTMDNIKDFPADAVINWLGFKITTKEFIEEVDKVANSFSSMGVKKGDIVTICSPTFPETIYANYALMKLGAIANNIDPRNNAVGIKDDINKVNSDYVIVLDIAQPKIKKIINETNVKNVICISYLDSVPKNYKWLYKIVLNRKFSKKGLKVPHIDYGDFYLNWEQFLAKGTDTCVSECDYEPNMPVVMVRTGGTTGTPKSVVLTNESGIALVEQYKATDLGLERGQSLLNIMPEFIAYGWTFGVVMATALGIENIIISQFDPDTFANDILKNKPNHIVGVPTHCISLIHDKRMKKADFSGFLKSISAGGDKFLEEAQKEFDIFLHEHGFDKNSIVGYGVTERNSSVATRLNKCNKIGSAGVPLVKNNISVFKFSDSDKNNGTEEELGYNEYGEVCISGPSAMLGYYDKKDETNEVQYKHSDGILWTHTKDRGYIDEDGVIYIQGRTKNMIIRPDGHNVWPLEMENVVLMHEDVEDCCVVGIPNKNNAQGEYPRAVIVLKENCKKNKKTIELELRELCLNMLPERDVPYSYSFVSSLPLTDVGKIDVAKVRKKELVKK